MAFDKNRALEDLEKLLSKKRYAHSLAVSKCAEDLAELYGLDKEKAKLAGFFHDFAKNMSDEESLRYLNDMGEKDEFLLSEPNLAHGKIAAYILEKHYGLDDVEVLSAIEKHTYGSADMSPLDKVVYLADATEPNRNYPNCDRIRKLSKENLDLACLEYLKNNIGFLIEKKKRIYTVSVEMYNAELERSFDGL